MGVRSKLLFAFATIIVAYLTAAGPAAARKFSDWSTPVLVPNVNSAFTDFGPAISRDERSLYFSSDRPGGMGNFDIWVCRRARVKDPWGTPVNLGPMINTDGIDVIPAFSRDGHWMFFHSNRPGGFGGLDLYVSYRRHTHDDFGWGTPVNLGAAVNTPFQDAGASYLANREQDDDDVDQDGDENEDEDDAALLFFGSTRPPGSQTNFELYASPQNSDGSFGLPTLLSELNSPCSDQRPSIRSDGLEIFFHSSRPAPGGSACAVTTDLWVARRDTLSQVWFTPENLGPIVNSASNEVQLYISSDGRTLYFASDRPGGPGLLDLYVTTRNKDHALSGPEK